MNNEERILDAFISKTNIKQDLNEILEYISKMFEAITKLHYNKLDIIDKNEEELINFIVKEALKNFFSSKIMLYIHDEYEEDKPVQIK